MVFILLVIDFVIPSWVLGPWFYVVNVFLILGIAVGIHGLAKGRATSLSVTG
ncbi:MAG: hypothetical protein JRM82_01835 [Nitrososphaerota archaeon]|nr:hypothetical protein [Nitrososphaerota archaeon]